MVFEQENYLSLDLILSSCILIVLLLDGIHTFSFQDEFLDIIYWLRQVLGVVMGLIWGALPVKGIVGIVL